MEAEDAEMLQTLLAQVCAELDIVPVPTMNEKKFIPFQLGESVNIEMRDLEPGFSFSANICTCPVKRREELFLELMRANYLGQATGSSRIGMSEDEKYLTLSLGIPYEVSYRTFRETLEDYINFLLYWRHRIEMFEQQETLL